MVMGLKAPLKVGETLPLTLVFEKQGQVAVDAKIGKPAARSGD
jgi:copper(I)-binding protein